VARFAFPVAKTKRGACGSMASCFASETGADDLYLAGIVQQSRQVLSSQGLIFNNNSSDPDPHGAFSNFASKKEIL
jgi:hypothetical protein